MNENWKRELLTDPQLSVMMSSLPAEAVWEQLTTDMGRGTQKKAGDLFTRLSAIQHGVTANIAREVSLRQNQLQECFIQSYAGGCRASQAEFLTHLQQLEKFNDKYTTVQKCLPVYTNACKLLSFATQLERFKVSVRLLKPLLQGIKTNQGRETSKEVGIRDTPTKEAQFKEAAMPIHAVKASKLIRELVQITNQCDLRGLTLFEGERGWVGQAKQHLFLCASRHLTNLLQTYSQHKSSESIEECLTVLHNLGRIKDFLLGLLKVVSKELNDGLKKAFALQPTQSCDSSKEAFSTSLQPLMRVRVPAMCRMLLHLQVQLQLMPTRALSNLFQRLWDKLVEHLNDLLKWSLQNKEPKSLKCDLFLTLLGDGSVTQKGESLSRLQQSLAWKYPILFNEMKRVAHQVHADVLKFGGVVSGFLSKKEKFMLTLVPLAVYFQKCLERATQPVQLPQRQGLPKLMQFLLQGVETPQIYMRIVAACLQALPRCKLTPLSDLRRVIKQRGLVLETPEQVIWLCDKFKEAEKQEQSTMGSNEGEKSEQSEQKQQKEGSEQRQQRQQRQQRE